jgi:flagellar basal-body rod modification protein FlgD
MTAVSSVSSGLTSSTTATDRVPMQTLGQNDFLQLLVAQMSSQDPMNPTKDSDFIAQMAQFSSLEQSKSMQADIASMTTQMQLQQANSLLGRNVTVAFPDSTTMSGNVSGIMFEAGTPKIVVNGLPFDLSQVKTIAPSNTAPNPTERILL